MRNGMKAGGFEGSNDWLLILGLKKDLRRLKLQSIDGLSDKVTSIIRSHIDNMKLLLLYSLRSIFYQCIYGCIPV